MSLLVSLMAASALSVSLQPATAAADQGYAPSGEVTSAASGAQSAASSARPEGSATKLPKGALPARSRNLADYKPPPWPEVPDLGQMVVRMVVGTGIVLGLSVLSLWAARRWLQPASSGGDRHGQMALLDTLRIGNRCAVHLIHVQGTRVLIGVDTNGLKSMVTLPERFAGVLEEAANEPETEQDDRFVPIGAEQGSGSAADK